MLGDRNHHIIFQDDNAPCHKPRAVDQCFDRVGIRRILWPAQSPHANPIENIWNDLSRAVIRDRPSTKQGLITFIYRAWANVTPQRVRDLYDSTGSYDNHN